MKTSPRRDGIVWTCHIGTLDQICNTTGLDPEVLPIDTESRVQIIDIWQFAPEYYKIRRSRATGQVIGISY